MLISESGITIAETAQRLGYDNASKFSAAFRDVMGSTPQNYRNSKNSGKFIEYRLVPLMVCSVNIGSELSAAALTRGLGTKVRRTNICKIGFHIQDIAILILATAPYLLLMLGMIGVIE